METPAGLDPYDLMDAEAARLDAFYAGLPEAAWGAPTACEGWDEHDLLAHLAASEEYNHACLDDAIGSLFERLGPRGVTDVHSFNRVGVEDRRDRSHGEVLEEWRAANRRTRTELRRRTGGRLPTTVGPYPVDWQALHLLAELATHADDAGVPVPKDEASARAAWRAEVARWMLAEARPDADVERVASSWRVRSADVDEVLDDDTFAAIVNGRAPQGTPDALRTALDLMP